MSSSQCIQTGHDNGQGIPVRPQETLVGSVSLIFLESNSVRYSADLGSKPEGLERCWWAVLPLGFIQVGHMAFTDEETEAQADGGTCPELPSGGART